MKSGRRVPFNPNKNRRRQWEPCRSSSSMGAGNNSRIDADDVQPAQTSQTTDTLPLIGTASRSTLTRPTCWLVRRSWRSASSCGDEIRLRSEGPSPRQIGSAPASLSDISVRRAALYPTITSASRPEPSKATPASVTAKKARDVNSSRMDVWPRIHHAPTITRVAMLKAEQHRMMTGATKFW
jgi:hypothetical protein